MKHNSLLPVAMATLLTTAFFVVLSGAAIARLGGYDTMPRERSFAFTYEVHVPADASGQDQPTQARLWVPLPQSDEHQTIRKLSLESAVAYRKGTEHEYENSYAVFTPTAAQVANGYDVTLTFDVTRREYARNVAALQEVAAHAGPHPTAANEMMLQRYLDRKSVV